MLTNCISTIYWSGVIEVLIIKFEPQKDVSWYVKKIFSKNIYNVKESYLLKFIEAYYHYCANWSTYVQLYVQL